MSDTDRDDILFRLAFDALPAALLIVDQCGTIVSLNGQLVTLTGCIPEAAIGRSISRFCTACEAEAGDVPFQIADGWRGDVEWRSQCRTPELFVASVYALPVADRFLVRLEPPIAPEDSPNACSHGQQRKLEAIGALASSVAHDLNNILTGVLGHVSYLRLSLGIETGGDSLAAIEDGARRAASLTQQILDFARGQQLELGAVNLSLVVAAVINLQRAAVGPNVALNFISGAEDIFVRGHESQISQLVMNLAVNAIEALAGEGRIMIRLERAAVSSPRRSFGLEISAGEYAKLSIADTGHGMPSALRDRIFEPFFTTKSQQGTGLGLATVRSIVRAHRGLIAVESEEGKGTQFDVFLPLAAPASQYAPESKPEDLPFGAEHILVVDDEEAVRTVIQRSLEHLGYTVVTANGGPDALTVFGSHPRRFGLVIIDMIMPQMSGDELFYRLRAIDGSVRVLVASGYSSDNRTKAILSDGALGFIQKPFAVDELAHEVRRCLDCPI